MKKSILILIILLFSQFLMAQGIVIGALKDSIPSEIGDIINFDEKEMFSDDTVVVIISSLLNAKEGANYILTVSYDSSVFFVKEYTHRKDSARAICWESYPKGDYLIRCFFPESGNSIEREFSVKGRRRPILKEDKGNPLGIGLIFHQGIKPNKEILSEESFYNFNKEKYRLKEGFIVGVILEDSLQEKKLVIRTFKDDKLIGTSLIQHATLNKMQIIAGSHYKSIKLKFLRAIVKEGAGDYKISLEVEGIPGMLIRKVRIAN